MRVLITFSTSMLMYHIPQRLDVQHRILKQTVYDGRLVYDKNVCLRPGDRVLDSGTGTGL